MKRWLPLGAEELIIEDNVLMSENCYAERDYYNLTHIVFYQKTVTKTVYQDRGLHKEKLEKLFPYLKEVGHPSVVPLLDYSLKIRPVFKGKRYEHAYRYTMKRMLPLTPREKDYVRAWYSLDDMMEDQEKRVLSEEEVEESLCLESDSRSPIYLFLQNHPLIPEYYHDFHEENLMKDAHGNFQLIDLESFLGEKSSWMKERS